MKTLVIIPAYNESANLKSLINDINSHNYDYLIINDKSTDSTEELANDNDFNILNLTLNVGIAGVTRIGYKYARDNNYDCVICIDGDGQHQPKYVDKLIKEVENGYDYVVGSRYVEEKKPNSLRMFGSRLICLMIRLKTGKIVYDPTSGMRALSRNVFEEFAEEMNFYAEPDMLCYLIRKRKRVKEVQVEMLDRQEGTSYFINPFKSINYMLGVITSILLIR